MKRININLIVICGYLLQICFYISSENIELRAAIDFGSGAIKIHACFIDKDKNTIIGEPVLSEYTGLKLTEDVAIHDGNISSSMEQMALNILRNFKDKVLAKTHSFTGNIKFAGIATAVFRKSKNGPELLKRFEEKLGINFKILSQEEEGHLGYMTARALFPEFPQENILAWDSGNGSFQLTSKDADLFSVYHGPLGHGTLRIILSKDIRKSCVLLSNESGNPIILDEAINLSDRIRDLLPATKSWLHDKLSRNQTIVAAFGDSTSIFALAAQALAIAQGKEFNPIEKAILSITDVQKIYDFYLGAEDHDFSNNRLHRSTLTSIILLLTVMKHFKMQKIYYKLAMGSTLGMLISPEFWQN